MWVAMLDIKPAPLIPPPPPPCPFPPLCSPPDPVAVWGGHASNQTLCCWDEAAHRVRALCGNQRPGKAVRTRHWVCDNGRRWGIVLCPLGMWYWEALGNSLMPTGYVITGLLMRIQDWLDFCPDKGHSWQDRGLFCSEFVLWQTVISSPVIMAGVGG